MATLKHGDRVELTRNLFPDLKTGMKGSVCVSTIDQYSTGVMFDGEGSISIGRMPGWPESKEYIKVIDCVKPI